MVVSTYDIYSNPRPISHHAPTCINSHPCFALSIFGYIYLLDLIMHNESASAPCLIEHNVHLEKEVMASTKVNISSEQVLDEWNSLVQREENVAYKVQVSCQTMEYNQGTCSDKIFQYCPSELREEICDWCYRVIDRW